MPNYYFPGFDVETNLPPQPTIDALQEAVVYERVFYQTVPSDLWVIIHDLPYRPSVTILDSAGNEKIGPINYITDNLIHFTPGLAFAGSAILR